MCGSINQDEADLSPVAYETIKAGLALAEMDIRVALTTVLMRAEPFHLGHGDLVDEALRLGNRTLLLLGSATESRSLDNPFTYAERKSLIEQLYPAEIKSGKLIIKPCRDMKYRDSDWLETTVNLIEKTADGMTPLMVGMEKDMETAACLALFDPHMKVHKVSQKRVLNATDIRAEYFSDLGDMSLIKGMVSKVVYDFLTGFKHTEAYDLLVLENKAVLKQQRINAEIKAINGFNPIYVAVDGLTIWKDHWGKPHILLITRKGPIGNGKYALVGGYVDAGKDTILSAVYRENMEEASLDLSKFILSGVKVFDSPKRSKRGHMITHVHHFWTKSDTPPVVIAGDDAETVQWVPLDQVAALQDKFFADHYHIIASMLPVVERFA